LITYRILDYLLILIILPFLNNCNSIGDRLLVTWPTYTTLPLTTTDAINGKWNAIDTECGIYGYRYRDSTSDDALTLLFDSLGNIAGVQVGTTASPSQTTWGTFDSIFEEQENGLLTTTIYLEDPKTICSAQSRVQPSAGDSIYLKLSNSGDYYKIAVNESDVETGLPNWIPAKCFSSMGTHYWKNITTDMDCEYFYPVGLMYHDGILVTFLIDIGNFEAKLETSPYWEAPPDSSLYLFF